MKPMHTRAAFALWTLSWATGVYLAAQIQHESRVSHGISAETPSSKMAQLSLSSPAMPFIENRGQLAEVVRFHAPSGSGNVFVTEDGEVVYRLFRGKVTIREKAAAQIREIRGEQRSVTRVHHFKGSDSSRWRSDLPAYDVVSLGEVFDGVELKLTSGKRGVEKIFRVRPGAEPSAIRMRLAGGRPPKLIANGELEVETAEGPVRLSAPIAYQEIAGERRPVEVGYRVAASGYAFRVGAYDRGRELIIDPILAASYAGGTELGLNSDDRLFGIARDSGGNLLVTGSTTAADFPGIGAQGPAPDSTVEERDALVAKLTPDLNAILAATFLGSSGEDDGLAITVDAFDNVYVAGIARSADFPGVTALSQDSVLVNAEGFVSKLNSDLSSLVGSTFLGGDENDNAIAIALDGSGHLFVAGLTPSTNFPGVTAASADSSLEGAQDGYVARLDLDLSHLVSSFLGGEGDEVARGVAVNTSGDVYVVGETEAPDFPGIGVQGPPADGVCTDCSGTVGDDAFVARLTSDLTAFTAATFLGGTNSESGEAIALDAAGNLYVAGHTLSEDFPGIGVQGSAADAVCDDCGVAGDPFVARLSPDLTSILAATYVGGGSGDQASAIVLDASGNVYLTGGAGSADFPGVGPSAADDTQVGAEAFVVRLDPSLSAFLAGTFVGGTGGETAVGIVLDGAGNVYIAGFTSSSDFPGIGPGSADPSFQGAVEGFLAKLDPDLSDNPPNCSAAAPSVPVIWEPNHRLVAVPILGVTDADGDPVTVTIASIVQDEPVLGVGSGNFGPDGSGIGTSTALLRAERSGTGDGRVYRIAFTASDGSGPACVGVVTVCVPHSRGSGVCGDQGALFDSTAVP